MMHAWVPLVFGGTALLCLVLVALVAWWPEVGRTGVGATMPKGLMDAEQWQAFGWLLIEGKMQNRDDWKLFCYVFVVKRVDVKWKGRWFVKVSRN